MAEEERERQYSPSSRLPDGDYRPYLDVYREPSTKTLVRSTGAEVSVLRAGTGDKDLPAVHIVKSHDADGPIPLLAFIHGGYWQELSAIESLFPAPACLARGWAYAAIDHTLAPTASLDAIVDEVRRAMTALVDRAPDLGLDPDRIVLAGHSAGAHLAAMTALGAVGAPHGSSLAGLVLVSGIYELEPLIGTSVDDRLGLDTPMAQRNSPLLATPSQAGAGFPPTLVAYGDDDTDEFRAQSEAYAHHLAATGTTVTTLEVADRHHFDVILDLAEPGTELGDEVDRLVRSTGRDARRP